MTEITENLKTGNTAVDLTETIDKSVKEGSELVRVEDLCEYFDIPTGWFKSKELKAVEKVNLTIKKGETLGVQ